MDMLYRRHQSKGFYIDGKHPMMLAFSDAMKLKQIPQILLMKKANGLGHSRHGIVQILRYLQEIQASLFLIVIVDITNSIAVFGLGGIRWYKVPPKSTYLRKGCRGEKRGKLQVNRVPMFQFPININAVNYM